MSDPVTGVLAALHENVTNFELIKLRADAWASRSLTGMRLEITFKGELRIPISELTAGEDMRDVIVEAMFLTNGTLSVVTAS